MKNKWLITLIIGIVFVLSIFTLSVYELTRSRNIGFDSYDLVSENWYEELPVKVKSKQEEYEDYINDNQDRIDSYDVDFENIILDVEQGNYDSVELLNEIEVDNYNLYKEDVQTTMKQELLELNIQALDMVQGKTYEGREGLYFKLKNLEILYDSFTYDIPIDEVNIADTDGMNLTNEDLTLWGTAIDKREINIILFIYLIVVIGVIIYLVVKKKNIRLLLIFTVILFVCVFIYRVVEENYYPTYIKINKLVGVNTDTEGNYFINFIPIMIVEAFENDGGDFEHYQVKHKDENGNEITEVKEVDWKSESSVEEWVDSPYLGDYNPDDREGVVPDVDGIYTNGEALAGIRDEMGNQLDSDGGAGYDGIAGWGYNPRGES